MTVLETISGGRTSTLDPDPVAPAPGFFCGSCGKPASVRRWYATPTDEFRYPEFQCGRCALNLTGDTLGTIAALLFDLGAS